MKASYLIAGLLLGNLAMYAQKTAVIATVAGLTDQQISIHYYAGKTPKADTVKVTGGQFSWTANMPEPQKVYIMFSQRFFPFFAERGKIRISGTADSLNHLKVTGSKTQEESEAYNASIKDITDQESALYQKYGKVSKEEQGALEQKIDALRSQKRSRADEYIAAHPGSAFSVSLVSDRALMGEYGDVQRIYDMLNDRARATVQGAMLAERLAVLQRSSLGSPMLDFTQNDTMNQPVQFASFKGKYVLVDFWASWCGPCRAENPNVLKVYNQYKDKGFTVVGVSLDDKEKNWKKAIGDDKMPWTQVSDLKGWKNEVAVYYGIQGIPTTFLVDPQGRIIAKNLRGEALHKKLAELLD
jgi:thiol-disulfide isomerase/thioredoxin